MKSSQLITIGKVLSIAVIILGIIHDIATFTPLIRGGLETVSNSNLLAITYMSLICGTSFILVGLMVFIILKKIEQNSVLAVLLLLLGVFIGLCGLLAVLFMIDNPFAWVALLINLCLMWISMKLWQEFKNDNN